MHALVAQVDARIRSRGLLAEGKNLLVAVSGGVDSMVLLGVLRELAPERRWRVVVAHYNHQLRGPASDSDARFVKRRARKLGLQFVEGTGDVRALARKQGTSVEMAARALRHEFLAHQAKRLGMDAVALAHHADDQVELFFLRLLRGSASGLSGMKWRGTSPTEKCVTLIRPLLDQPKAVLLDFARSEKIRFREDVSNGSLDILRNRVRGELLPLLRRHYQPGLDRAVLRTMEIVGQESDFVQAAAREWMQVGEARAFDKLPIAVQRQCVRLDLSLLDRTADFDLVERLRLKPDVLHSCHGGWLVRDAKSGRVSVQSAVSKKFSATAQRVGLSASRGGDWYDGVSVKWLIRKRALRSKPSRARNRESFDADKVGAQILLRHWRPGDRFQPIGTASGVKLQDLFTNAKVPAPERRRLIVAEAEDGEIFWVEGLRMSERFKLRASTRRELEWRWRRGEA